MVIDARKRGFTLLELIVAITLFSFAVTIAMGALLALMVANKKAMNIQTNQDNLRYAINLMSREIRSGVDYYVDSTDIPVLGAKTRIQFRRDAYTYYRFSLSDDPALCAKNSAAQGRCILLERAPVDPASGLPDYTDPLAAALPLTAPEVDVERLTFLATCDQAGDTDCQPRVTIAIIARTPRVFGKIGARLNVQTTISPLKLK